MPGSFTVQFFDLLTYLLPGTVILYLVLCFSRPFLQTVLRGRHIAHILFSGILAMLALGIMDHVLTTAAQGVCERVAGVRVVDTILKATPETATAEKVAEGLPIPRTDRIQFLRYAETLVEEALPHRAERAQRLKALALFCRNLVLPTLAVGIALCWRRRRHASGLLLTALVTLATCSLCLYGYLVYTKNSVFVTLRAFSSWYLGLLNGA